MFWQCPVLAIQARTTDRGVWKPVAMFSPADRQSKPTALIRAAKFEPWLNTSLETIAFVQFWAERSSSTEACSGGRWRPVRCWLIRQTTAARSAWTGARPTIAVAFAQPLAGCARRWRRREFCVSAGGARGRGGRHDRQCDGRDQREDADRETRQMTPPGRGCFRTLRAARHRGEDRPEQHVPHSGVRLNGQLDEKSDAKSLSWRNTS